MGSLASPGGLTRTRLSASNTTLPRASPSGRRGFLSRSKSAGQILGEAGAQSTTLLQNLTKAVRDTEQEIAQDEKSLKEMKRQLDMMRAEAERLERRIAEEERVVDAMRPDRGLGNAMNQFDRMRRRAPDIWRNPPQAQRRHRYPQEGVRLQSCVQDWKKAGRISRRLPHNGQGSQEAFFHMSLCNVGRQGVLMNFCDSTRDPN